MFLSYSSRDDEAFEFCKNLESKGLRCWIAPRNIVPGVPYARAIMQGLNGADTVVVFISRNSLLSEDVLNEVDNAHGLKKNIIPVFIEKVDLTPEFSYYLKRKQWINAYNDKDEAIAQIHRAIGKPPVAPSKDIIDASISNQKNENKEIYYDIILTDIGQSNILGEVVAFKNVFGGSLPDIKNFIDDHRNGSILLATLSDKEEIEIIRQAFIERKGKIECRVSSATEPYRIKPPKREISQKTEIKDIEEETPEQWYVKGIISYKKKDYYEAKQCFLKASKQGHTQARYCLNHMYRYGTESLSDILKL